MDRPAVSAAPHSDRDAGARRSGAPYDRVLPVALALSVLLHVVVVVFDPTLFLVKVTPRPYAVGPVRAAAPAGIRVIGIEAVEGDVPLARADDPDEPVEISPVRGPAGVPGAPDVSAPFGSGLIAPGPTAAERLRPVLRDRRIWAPLDRGINDLTPEQREELALAGRIAEWQDSVAAAAAAESALTDWTTTDAQGKRWGISPGAIHLGDVTLPLPFAFGTPVGQRDQARERAWEWEEITRGAASGAVRDSWKERAQAIRERRDRERAKAKPDTTPRVR